MDPRARFSDRVQDYIRYRPGYPAALRTILAEAGLAPGAAVADLGSGTGILSALLLDWGCRVYGVEPNAEMRAASAALLAGWGGFTAVEGSSEATGLADGSVDAVVAAQAFHWFEPAAARRECLRVLRPGGFAAMIWNTRRLDSTPFLIAYEAFMHRWGTDYARVAQRYAAPEALATFFGGAPTRAVAGNAQALDRAGLVGRILSCSYIPGVDHPDRAPMLAAAEALFDAHQRGGQVVIDYDTEVFLGPLGGADASGPAQ